MKIFKKIKSHTQHESVCKKITPETANKFFAEMQKQNTIYAASHYGNFEIDEQNKRVIFTDTIYEQSELQILKTLTKGDKQTIHDLKILFNGKLLNGGQRRWKKH